MFDLTKTPLRGIVPPLVTPLTDNETLDVESLERLIEHLIRGGVHGLFVLGTTGEEQSLSYAVREQMIREWPGAVHFSDVELFVDAVFFADFAFWSAAGPEWSVEGVDGGHFAHADFAVDECRRAFHEAEDVGEVVFDAGEVEFVEDDEVARCGVAVHEEFDVGDECDERGNEDEVWQ